VASRAGPQGAPATEDRKWHGSMTYCLGGTTTPALCRPATMHVTSERNRHRQLLSKTIFTQATSHTHVGYVSLRCAHGEAT
jgi:hypothetical protein